MIVYSASLQLTNHDVLTKVAGAVETWLSEKKGLLDISPLMDQPARREFGDGVYLETARSEDDDSPAFAVRFAHPDRHVRGREWLTEVGVRVGKGESNCTIVLHTSESSAQVSAQVETTRPLVVPEILGRCSLSSGTAGGKLRYLTEADCEAFDWTVRDPDRRHPLVLVSPRERGGYCVDPNRLNDLLVGIADVVLIPESTDTFAIADAIGSQLCAYHGAVNILWPVVNRVTGSFVPSTRLLTADLENVSAQGKRPEPDILALIGHRTNAANARAHISPERVQTLSLRAALTKAGEAKTVEDADLASLYKQVDEDQRAEICDLKSTLEIEERERNAADSQVKELDNTVKALQGQLQRAGSTTSLSTSELSDEDRNAIVQAMADNAALHDCLEAIGRLYRGRVVILDSALASARKANKFNAPRKAFDLLSRLCSEYYNAMITGKGTNAARQIFGKNAFSPKESETVEGNRRAVKLRTFTYKDEDTPMMAHLKIGVKPSVAETFRCHFLWDSDDRVIVIGHCGKHLDHK